MPQWEFELHIRVLFAFLMTESRSSIWQMKRKAVLTHQKNIIHQNRYSIPKVYPRLIKTTPCLPPDLPFPPFSYFICDLSYDWMLKSTLHPRLLEYLYA